MRVVIVDNFDSFTHNLAQAFGGLGAETLVVRNTVSATDIASLRADRVVLSPGPGTPDRTGCCADLVDLLGGRTPILGVCLGMQLLARLAGARIVRATQPVHGRASAVEHDGCGVFEGVPSPCQVGRYHSLVVEPSTLPPQLIPTAWSGGVLMGLRHRRHPTEAVQFHPESVLTPEGTRMLGNFLVQGGLREELPEGPR